MKARTQEHAERSGHTAVWTFEDAVAAQLEANTFALSPVDPRRSPQQMWQARVPLAQEERDRLTEQVNRFQAEETASQEGNAQAGAAGEETAEPEVPSRVAMRRALGYLILRWRRISPPI